MLTKVNEFKCICLLTLKSAPAGLGDCRRKLVV